MPIVMDRRDFRNWPVNATLLFYMTEEGQEGRNAFNEKRKPDFAKFPYRP